VVRLDATTKRVYAGPKEALAKHYIYLKEVNWLSDIRLFKDAHACQIKIRSSATPINATVKAISPTEACVTFAEPEYGIAAGQAGVFYDGDRVLGGGWIFNKEE
jgi:tRNA-specific 2-thiouridylase